MTSIGVRLDLWTCQLLQRAGVRTPLFCGTVDRQFAICFKCRRVFPHWWGNMTPKEARRRGFLGCPCGGLKLDLAIIPGWQAAWWVVVRGFLIRKCLLRRRLWDPRVPVRDR